MISFTCPACKFALTRADNEAGQKVSCPSCNQRLKIPQPPAPPKDKTMLGQIQSPTAAQTILGQLTPQPSRQPEPVVMTTAQDQPTSLWYANVLGEQMGPFTPAQLQEMATEGTLNPDDLVTQDGAKQWSAAKRLNWLTFPSSTPAAKPNLPPLPQRATHSNQQDDQEPLADEQGQPGQIWPPLLSIVALFTVFVVVVLFGLMRMVAGPATAANLYKQPTEWHVYRYAALTMTVVSLFTVIVAATVARISKHRVATILSTVAIVLLPLGFILGLLMIGSR
jgi:hypothetical protein